MYLAQQLFRLLQVGQRFLRELRRLGIPLLRRHGLEVFPRQDAVGVAAQIDERGAVNRHRRGVGLGKIIADPGEFLQGFFPADPGLRSTDRSAVGVRPSKGRKLPSFSSCQYVSLAFSTSPIWYSSLPLLQARSVLGPFRWGFAQHLRERLGGRGEQRGILQCDRGLTEPEPEFGAVLRFRKALQSRPVFLDRGGILLLLECHLAETVPGEGGYFGVRGRAEKGRDTGFGLRRSRPGPRNRARASTGHG